MEWDNDIYINVHDNQGTGWALGRILTLKDWRDQAIDWADTDCNEELKEAVINARDDEVLDFISDIWDIHIKPMCEVTTEEFEELKDCMHLC